MKKSVKTGKAVKRTAGKKTVKKPAAKTKNAPKTKSAAVAKKPAAKPALANKRSSGTLKTRAKSAPARKPKKASGAGNTLLAELRAAVSGLDAEGIRHLIRQAAVLKHNMGVMKDHAERKKMATVDAMRKGGGVSNKTTIDVKEADDGSSFILIINNARNFFALDEMRKLVGICHAATSETDAAGRLYNWFVQYRKDILIDTDIDSASDPALATMYRFIKGKYALKQG
ncbi:MAG: hypothetical protein EHM32_04375 [Spirochaetales bacterium]|nr:MAG: hypothetical protein EHM32_04375 [Spirochaetales bacterium]